jgi:glycoprotein endo-alpha-1,2-mannosidase
VRNIKAILLYIILISVFFTHFAQVEPDYAVSLRFRIRTTSDWTRVEIRGIGEPRLSNYSSTPSWYRLFVSSSDNCTSIWIGKPQYDETLVEVNLDIVSINPANLQYSISKGYIGYTEVKTSIWNKENYREIGRLSHTITQGDLSHNRYSTTLNHEALSPYQILVEEVFCKQDKQVLAVYYPWYGSAGVDDVGKHWGRINGSDIELSLHHPVLGAYSSQNTTLIRKHIDMAAKHGIDGFAVSWWGVGSYEDKAFREILNASSGFKACVYYETNRGSTPLSPSAIASELNYIIENYGNHENYLKYYGKPVIFVFNAAGFSRDSDFWAQVRSNTLDAFLVGDFRTPQLIDVFDGVHIYNELDPDEHWRINEWISQQNKLLPCSSVPSFNKLSQSGILAYIEKLTVGTVSPGFDDTKIRPNGIMLPRREGETYEESWEMLYGLDFDWVLITSWNEWHEGTEIEPSLENGYTALNETLRQVELFKGG